MSRAPAPAVHALPLLANDEVARDTFWLSFRRPDGVGCDPGQFFMLSPVEPCGVTFLGRPFSIGDVRDGRWRFLLRALGRGTAWMRDLAPGAPLRLVGPLGRPFAPPARAVHRMVAGGIGLAPFPYLARRIRRDQPAARIELVYGERTADLHTALDDDERALFDAVERRTDDGTRGAPGTAVDGAEPDDGGDAAWYGCGPRPMLAALARRLAAGGVEGAQFSLEERMACGFGVCQACVVETREPPPRYRLLCVDGPVLDAREVAW